MLKVFFAFTRPQLFYVNEYAKKSNRSEMHVYYFGDERDTDRLVKSLFKEIRCLKGKTGRLSRLNIDSYKFFKKQFETIQHDLEIELCFPGLAYPIFNWIYSKYSLNKNVSVTIYAEGLSSYLNIKTPFFWNLKFSILRLIPPLFGGGVGCKIVGHSYGLDMPNVSALISQYPKLLAEHGKPIVDISSEIGEPVALSHQKLNEVWVLGQGHFVDIGDCQSYFDRLYRVLFDTYHCKIIYKTHHFEPKRFSVFASRAGFEICDSKNTLEELLVESAPKVVLGYRSTALLNARRMCASDVSVVAFAPFLVNPPDESGDVADIYKVFKYFNVSTPQINSELWLFEEFLRNKFHA